MAQFVEVSFRPVDAAGRAGGELEAFPTDDELICAKRPFRFSRLNIERGYFLDVPAKPDDVASLIVEDALRVPRSLERELALAAA